MRKERKYVVTVWRVGTPTDGIWYWQLAGSNGRPIAVCPQAGYTSKRNAANAVNVMMKIMTDRFFTVRVVEQAAA
jgi:uncharacterized protein YegP (UPF0339 family)